MDATSTCRNSYSSLQFSLRSLLIVFTLISLATATTTWLLFRDDVKRQRLLKLEHHRLLALKRRLDTIPLQIGDWTGKDVGPRTVPEGSKVAILGRIYTRAGSSDCVKIAFAAGPWRGTHIISPNGCFCENAPEPITLSYNRGNEKLICSAHTTLPYYPRNGWFQDGLGLTSITHDGHWEPSPYRPWTSEGKNPVFRVSLFSDFVPSADSNQKLAQVQAAQKVIGEFVEAVMPDVDAALFDKAIVEKK
jgi:hypothetical protein